MAFRNTARRVSLGIRSEFGIPSPVRIASGSLKGPGRASVLPALQLGRSLAAEAEADVKTRGARRRGPGVEPRRAKAHAVCLSSRACVYLSSFVVSHTAKATSGTKLMILTGSSILGSHQM